MPQPRRGTTPSSSSPWTLVFLLIVLLALAIPVAGASAFVFAYWHRDAILPGVRVSHVPVGRLDPLTALERLEAWAQEPRVLLIQVGDGTIPVTYEELGVELDRNASVAAAYRVGRRGPLWERAVTAARALSRGEAVRPRWRVDEERLRRAVETLAARLASPARSARLVAGPDGSATILPHSVSVRVTPDRLRRLLLDAVERNATRLRLAEGVELPPLTEQQLREWGIDARLAAFETVFSPAERDRAVNIQLAARALDGVVVEPGGRFSFNGTVGPRTPAQGYRKAPVIVAGRFVDDYGGGVCQVSTTLYNAALLAGLDILARAPHSVPVSYVPLGRDAAVVYGAVDLAFRNPYPRPLLIQTEVEVDRVRVEIFGPAPYRKHFRLETAQRTIPAPLETVVDPALPPGEQRELRRGRPGYRVELFRVETSSGSGAGRRERIAVSHYAPEARLVAIPSSPDPS